MKPRTSKPSASKQRNPAREREWISSILDNIALIETMTVKNDEASFFADAVAQKAVKMCLIEISEAAGRLTLDLQARHPDLPWRAIEDLRNAYTHEYHIIDVRLMWRTARERLGELKTALSNEATARKTDRT